jgi:hypothetical protein
MARYGVRHRAGVLCQTSPVWRGSHVTNARGPDAAASHMVLTMERMDP